MRLSDNESTGAVMMLGAMTCFASGAVGFDHKFFLGFAWGVALVLFLAGIIFLVEDGPERFFEWFEAIKQECWDPPWKWPNWPKG